MKIKKWEAAVAAALVITIIYGTALSIQQNRLNEKLIRLHVVANSDTSEDQTLKLKVRDAVLNDLDAMLKDTENKENASVVILSNIENLKTTAENEIIRNGFNYPVAVTLEKEVLPTREYDTFSLPAGVYDSLRIKIGEGAGRNWWCVVFPPVCAASTLTEADAAAVGLSESEYKLITESSEGYVIKFRFMELLGKLKGLF